MRIEQKHEKEFDDLVVESIDSFRAARNELIGVILAIAKYRPAEESYRAIHRFLERLLPYGFWPPKKKTGSNWDEDNLRFLVHEIFLYCVAGLLRYEKFEGVRELVEQDYFFPSGYVDAETGMVAFVRFQHYLKSLAHRNKRLGLGRLSLVADMLKERATGTGVGFEVLMESDFVLYLHSEFHPCGPLGNTWRPETLVYASGIRGVFELFARAQSMKYFDKLKMAIGAKDKSELERFVDEVRSGARRLPKWNGETFYPGNLMDVERLASRP